MKGNRAVEQQRDVKKGDRYDWRTGLVISRSTRFTHTLKVRRRRRGPFPNPPLRINSRESAGDRPTATYPMPSLSKTFYFIFFSPFSRLYLFFFHPLFLPSIPVTLCSSELFISLMSIQIPVTLAPITRSVWQCLYNINCYRPVYSLYIRISI